MFDYPVQAMFQFSMCFGAVLMMCSVQCEFPCYLLLVLCFSSACISMLSSPCTVFQFSVYFHAILSLHCVSVQCVFPCYPLLVLCFSSVCVFTLSCPRYVSVQHVFWHCPLPMACLVQRVFPGYPLLMMCFSSACISMLSSPYDMFSSVCISMLSSPYAVFQFSMYFGAILMMCSVQCISMLFLSLCCVSV